MAVKGILTDRQVSALKVGESISDPAPRGAGRLQARKLKSGVAWYFRYTGPDGHRVRHVLGSGLTLAEARKAASEYSRIYQQGNGDLRGQIEINEREAQHQVDKAAAQALAKQARAAGTLGVLLLGYVAGLRKKKKVSADYVERALRRHVEQAWPGLWGTPAADITADDLLAVLAPLANAGSLREAEKLRAYLRAAYAAAIAARRDTQAVPELRDLRIASNPARDLTPIEGANKARKRKLSLAELRAYWKRINDLPDPDGALLRFHLLTGAQRVEQMARAKTAEVDPDARTIRLEDIKGRRKVARVHMVPLTHLAEVSLDRMAGRKLGPHLFTVTEGLAPASYATVQVRLKKVMVAMLDAGELPGGPFSVGDLRRTVETRLAGAKVGKLDRAQLQSHGLGGVQDRHYDGYEYLDEKIAALKVLQDMLTSAAPVADAGRL